MTTMIPLDQIELHPGNVRFHAEADEEMVESIRHAGLLQAVTVAPFGDVFRLIDGHRRYDGARKAGLLEVPALLRDDLVTEGQQLEAMLMTSLHREDLTKVEEAAGYEQLTFLGMDAAAIAKGTGRSVAVVKSRLRLNALPEAARTRLHGGEITLADAETLLEFEDDHEAHARLEAALGTDNFRFVVQDLRARRERMARNAATIAEYEALGAVPFEGDANWSRDTACPLMWFGGSDELRDAAGHDGCLAYTGSVDSFGHPFLVCKDAGSHPSSTSSAAQAEREQQQSEWEKGRAEREAKAARRDAAARARVEWLRDHFTGLLPVKAHARLAQAAQAVLPALVIDDRESIDSTLLLAALGVTVDYSDPSIGRYRAEDAAKKQYATDLAVAKPTRVLASFAAWLAAVVADQLNVAPYDLDDEHDALRYLAVWDWLKTAGYPLSDADIEVRTELEVRHAELTTEAKAS